MSGTANIVTQIERESRAQRAQEQKLSEVSPFEVKNLLLHYAKEDHKKQAFTLLNAGRGNPNWICTLPRQAFYLLGAFSLEECERAGSRPQYDLAGMPQKQGAGERLSAFLKKQGENKAAAFLQSCVAYCRKLGIAQDDLATEWAQGMAGCLYPVPVRILDCTQQIVAAYLKQEMFGGKQCDFDFDLFATEGGTAAMCYLFYSLKCNNLLKPGDKIALMAPIFTPYLNIPHLNDFDLDVVYVNATAMTDDGRHAWQYPDSEIQKLADPSVKLLCLVNPSNPPSYALDEASHRKLVQVVSEKNPDLLIITDDVYGTFVPGYRSVFADLPKNTALVYSFSKYFGATGWRLADIAIARGSKFDELIAAAPSNEKQALAKRYSCLTDDLPHERFIDRMVADSRLVALNGTAGLSTPQQVQMSLFALYSLLDEKGAYKAEMRRLVCDRYDDLWNSFGFKPEPDPLRAGYYSIIDLELWATKIYGADFSAWLKKNYDSLDIVMRLAKDTGVVLMDGAGFDAPDWSVRVSLANLDAGDYPVIGQKIRSMLDDYYLAYKAEIAKR